MTKFTPRPMRAANGYDTKQASLDSTQSDWGPSMTIQSHAIDADINVIMERFGVTGKMPDNIRNPEYADFSGIYDYRTALDTVRAAQENFMLIPAKIRARFENDPQQYLEFVSNPANLEEMRTMGLAKPSTATPPAPPPAPVGPVVPPAETTAVVPPAGKTTT